MLLLFLLLLLLLMPSPASSDRPNLLFITHDDLRPDLSIYGNQNVITPNYERLASRSVVFDWAFCQVAVCNPSRDSVLTGLRPDFIGTHGFQHSFRPNMILPSYLALHNYATVGFGKVLHWDGPDKEVWTEGQDDGGWKKLTQVESKFMNATTTPDQHRDESEFLDYRITTSLIRSIERLANKQSRSVKGKPFMAAIGFKLPHVPVHVPFKYFDMYRHRISNFSRPQKELTFPLSSPLVAHKCCANQQFRYMKHEGAAVSDRAEQMRGRHTFSMKQEVHTEIMWGYMAAITFLDAQLGRILDTLDRLELWKDTVVVLTSDHGMHNGEKGIWEKWTLFDEASRVPLLISHPSSPVTGVHYPHPVELVDIFPTLTSLLHLPDPSPKTCSGASGDIRVCPPLQGKSLESIILGRHFDPITSTWLHPSRNLQDWRSKSIDMEGVAVSQVWRCAMKSKLKQSRKLNPWFNCDVDASPQAKQKQVSVMGYSFRSSDFRYNMWLRVNQSSGSTIFPFLEEQPMYEELYDHRGDGLRSFTHSELINLAESSILESDQSLRRVVDSLKAKYLDYLRSHVTYHAHSDGVVD